jgi:hypothetical protein
MYLIPVDGGRERRFVEGHPLDIAPAEHQHKSAQVSQSPICLTGVFGLRNPSLWARLGLRKHHARSFHRACSARTA